MEPTLITGAFGVVGAAIGAIGTWLVARTNKAPDVQETLDKAVAGIIKHYTDAIGDLKKEVERLRETINEQSEMITALETHIDALTSEMTTAGMKPPKRVRAS